jgi:hypothetical protein
MKNTPFAFGGEDTSRVSMKAVVLAENSYQLEGVMSLFADSESLTVPLIPMSKAPSNEYGDLKTGYYSYETLKSQATGLPLFIENVDTAKLTNKASKSLADNLCVGFLDFDICQQRNPRT